mmetsp:Transcript_29451/g.49729  ORF Transcript_29451/g.49729 Transcript_29451/m.49729 type:complete len:225 (-) Transcript_29451:1206-1880(-)
MTMLFVGFVLPLIDLSASKSVRAKALTKVILPRAFIDVTRLVHDAPKTVLSTFGPLACAHAHFSAGESALAVIEVSLVLAGVVVTVAECVAAKAMALTVHHVSLIYVTTAEVVTPVALALPLVPLAAKAISIHCRILPAAVLAAVFPATVIVRAICIPLQALAMPQSRLPLARVAVSIHFRECTVSVSSVILPTTLIGLACGQYHFTVPVHTSPLEVAFVIHGG